MLKPKFEVGQTMYVITDLFPRFGICCPCCDGKGIIKAIIKDCLKTDVCCPFCNGRGYLYDGLFSIHEGCVKAVNIYENKITYKISYELQITEITPMGYFEPKKRERTFSEDEETINYKIKPPYIFSSLELAEEKLRLLREE